MQRVSKPRVVVPLIALAIPPLLLLACANAGTGTVTYGIATPTTPATATMMAAQQTPTATPPASPTTVLPSPTSSTTSADAQASDFAARIIARTNAYRTANGCPALTVNGILMGIAQAHSADMALHDFAGHQSSDGTPPWDRIKAAGYTYRLVAENVAWGRPAEPEAVVDAWFDETPPDDLHRKNILNCALHEIGVGYYYLADDPGQITAHAYWTEDLGTPLP
jgi:uncharacterized protein YkwD